MKAQLPALLKTLLFAVLAFFVTNSMAAIQEDIDVDGYDKVLIPYNHGRIKNTSEYSRGRYPSLKQNMQFMLFFDENSTTGYYVQTEDSAGNQTDWEIRDVNGKRTLRLKFYAATKPNIIKQTITIEPDKPYLAAAEKYKAWAFQQYWAKRKPSKMDSVKYIVLGSSSYFTWLKNTALPPLLDRFEEPDTNINNPATATWLTLWRDRLFDVGYPRYEPDTQHGVFSDLLSWLKSRGSLPIPFLNGTHWDVTMSDPDGPSGPIYSDDYMIKDSNGNLTNFGTGQNLAYVCPGEQIWKDIILNARNNKLLDSNGIKSDGVYYDVVASTEPFLCNNPAHSHAPNDPLNWQQSYRQILADTDGVVMIEGSAEIYIDLTDVFLMHLKTDEAGRVPLWDAVYGTITRTAGWYVDANNQTPTGTMAAFKEARSFGSRTWGSPILTHNGSNSWNYQMNMLNSGYEDVINMISAAPVMIEDGSNGVDNWWGSGNISNVFDADYGKNVIQKTGAGVAHTDYPEWTYTGTNARWSVKRTNPNDMISGFKVTTVSNKIVYLYYTDASVTAAPILTGTGPYYIYHGIGIAPSVNGWQIIDRDLEVDLRSQMPAETIAQVKQFLMFNNPGSVADIKLFPRLP
ncbi:MAG: hypothetical protein HPY82_07110 [Gammaproteobacteria bacterium]|nr:hypothetical protein [Gammaproteobacteria bacterium]